MSTRSRYPRSRYPNALATAAATALLIAAVLTFAACGDDNESYAKNDTDEPIAAEQVAATGSDAQVAPIVGRWQQVHTCQQLVDGLKAEGLGAIAPAMVGDYFPDQTYDELAAKDDVCSGAKPQQHSHFFTASGFFGSVDQYGNQVDDGTYVVVDSDTIQIGGADQADATFDYSIQGGVLRLTPMITDKQRREALRQQPEEFSTAGWMVAVSYPGTKWKKVPCQGWC